LESHEGVSDEIGPINEHNLAYKRFKMAYAAPPNYQIHGIQYKISQASQFT
jgi:hypothetical protein